MKKKKDKSRYYPPEMMPFVLCSACLEIVLDESEEARKLYDEIIECFSLSGCQETFVGNRGTPYLFLPLIEILS